MSVVRKTRSLRWLAAASLTCAFGFSPAAIAGPEPLAEARRQVTLALDAESIEPRHAALFAAARHYRIALRGPALTSTEARYARQALRAIDRLLHPPASPTQPLAPPESQREDTAHPHGQAEAQAVTTSAAPIVPANPTPSDPPASKPSIVSTNVDPPISDVGDTNTGPAETNEPANLPIAVPEPVTTSPTLAVPQATPIVRDRRTLAVALALLDAPASHIPAYRQALSRGANVHGRFGPGLQPPAHAGDALHTLIAVAALTQHGPLSPDHAHTLAAVLLLEQSPEGGWRDPLTPIERTGSQTLPTAANLLTLRLLVTNPSLSESMREDLVEAQRRGRLRLQDLRASPTSANPYPSQTFSHVFLEHILAALDADDDHTAFRNAIAAQLRNHHATQPLEQAEWITDAAPAPR
ncbi:MAG: hypothetical protein AAGF84_05155 [Planctomycetota bacterium]